MGIEAVSLIIAAFVNGSLGIAALMRNFRSRLCVAFAALCGLLFAHDGLSVLENFDADGGFSSPRLHIFIVLLLGPVTIGFLKELVPVYREKLQRWNWIYSLCLGLFCVPLLIFKTYGRFSALYFFSAHLLLLIPAGLWILSVARATRQSRLTRERLRLKYAVLGGIGTAVIYLTNLVHFFGLNIPPLGTLARVLYLLFLFQTFIQKELTTSEEVIAKSALFGGIALILSTIYSLLVSWVGDQPGLFFFNTFIASFVIIVLFDPIRNLTAKFTQRILLPRNAMVEDELNSLSQALMGVVEPTELSRRITIALKRCLGIEAASLYVLERDGLSYVAVEATGKISPLPVLSSSSPLVEYMALKRGKPFVLESIENDRDSFHSPQSRKFCESCMENMRNIGADFVIPYLHEAKLVGFSVITTGEKIIMSNEQLRLFAPISRQVAFLLRNAQTFSFLSDREKLAAIGEMAAGLAHEIKNPLGAIKGAAELLKEEIGEKPGKNATEFLTIILDESRRLSTVLTEFLDYAKPRRNYPQTTCDPLKVIEHTTAMLLRDSNVNVEIATASEGLNLEADPEVLKQVMLNLFLNSVQAMEGFTQNPKLTVMLREVRPRRPFPLAEALPLYKVWEGWEPADFHQRPYIEIEVVDNGVGISVEDIPRIFVPFYTTKPKGTGLGLAICQRLIEGMGGTIQARANHPTGSIFTIHLPVKREEGSESPSGKSQSVDGTLT